MLKEFKEFISRGSVLDLAVGVIIGGAFTAIVNAFVVGIITPLIGLVISLIVPGSTDMEDATKGMVFKVNNIEFNYGSVISAIVTFLITAFVLFMIIKAVNKANSVIPKEELVEEEPVVDPQEAILEDIRALLQEQVNATKIDNKNTSD
ncbi:MAG: large conductance mechanosensitive channel protein MscL [Vagococcus sp.]